MPKYPKSPVPALIRSRREELGLAGYELAKRAGISPSYLSLIENGDKVPRVKVAIRIAQALGEDPELFRVWARYRNYPDPREYLESRQELQQAGSPVQAVDDVKLSQVAAEEDEPEPVIGASARRLMDLPAASRRALRLFRKEKYGEEVRQERQSMDLMSKGVSDWMVDECSLSADEPSPIEVPLLSDGTDPGEDPMDSEEILDVLRLDPQLLPPGIERPFAYRPGESFLVRVRPAINPGDVVVLAAVPEAVNTSGIFAVRQGSRVVLSRVALSGTILLLLPPEGESPVSIDCRSERGLRERLAGEVVATIRSWRPSRVAERRPEPAALLGRSVRVEGEFLVRDCEWKENYGWRPVQRPEDLDYLEAHPGTKIRFRLLRDGRVKYLLEMSPEEWRRALGDYVDGPAWRRNGYIVAITKKVSRTYTEEFQDRWGGMVRAAED